PSAWVKEPVVIAAVDGLSEEQSKLNKKILQEAAHLSDILDGELYVVSAYPFSEPWMGPATLAVDFEKVKRDVEDYIRGNITRWMEELGIQCKFLCVEEGRPAHVIAQLAESSHAELLVLGTVARSGVKGIVLGNTSETIIHRTFCDVVVLK
ncbi:MAG: universal stress protein, partial [Gammaproteobacteria bacterium]|nr:universal stress protein [Gammaproteobacteria bacterium]